MERLKTSIGRAFSRFDAWLNRLYGWRHNPLYQSGTLVVLALLIMLVTGLYLLLFYRIGAPAESVGRITEQAWSGRWIRSLHRYAADLAIVAAAVHALRMFAQGRSWGPRALAWVSGLFLVFLLYVCGWTGYVMVWDAQAHLLAEEGARLLDVLPLFSVPISRAFSGQEPLPSPFFFLNLFLHIAVPIGMAGGLWLHVSRVARPVLLPPKGLLWGTTALLFLISVVWPVPMYPVADLLDLPGQTPIDFFYAFWLPVSQALPAVGAWLAIGSATLFAVLIPVLARPKEEHRPGASVVESRFCTGCEQCYVDCPYDAIRMVPRDDGRDYLIAAVDPALCVSCGICAGSCAPMGVGPPNRTGRDQLATVRSLVQDLLPDLAPDPVADSTATLEPVGDPQEPRVVIISCDRSAAGAQSPFEGSAIFPVSCAGNLHSSTVEYLIRAGAAGVLVCACPPRDCWNREGPIWLEQRLFHDREAELQARVDKERVRVVYAGAAEQGILRDSLLRFRKDLMKKEAPVADSSIEIDLECVVPEGEEVPT
ncbi:MAG: hydrogenase iron-sulfur subunit [Gemmatimonadetes bacterium]|nr:hydrogenase iron-sulfur subunit [Gemmatimonadota bacterium]